MRTIRLQDCFNIVVTLFQTNGVHRYGTIESNLKVFDEDSAEPDDFTCAMDAIESVILAHACAGVDIEDAKYVEGLRTSINAIANKLL